jgi:hypothetical protein
MSRDVRGKSHFFATFDRRIAIPSAARCPIRGLECDTGPDGRFNRKQGATIMDFTDKPRLGASDLIAYLTLIFAIGLAVSLVLAGAVLLLAGQPV